MKKITLLLITLFAFQSKAVTLSLNAAASPWVTAYYAGWWTQHKGPSLKPDQIDYTALTHIIYFAVILRDDGTVDLAHYHVDSPEARQLTALAHGAGKKALISVATPGISKPDHLDELTDNLVDVVKTLDYDGIDIDWEPLQATDADIYARLIHSLRTKLDQLSKQTHKSHYLITVAVIDQTSLFAKIQNDLDQINLMTYDLSGLWLGQTWHNTPLYSPKNSDLPSIDSIIKDFKTAGVASKKLAVGIDFYGYQWASTAEELTEPQQEWVHEPVIVTDISYTDIVTKFVPVSLLKWDNTAHVPYLSSPIHNGQSFFLTYDDASSCKAKMHYVLSEGLGGIMAWELGGQWLENATIKDPLLQSLKIH